jgi:Mrp family chromosome partitioning ATPase
VIARRTLERAGLGRLPPEALLDHSDTEPQVGALALRVRASRPSAAVGLANAYAREFASAVRRRGAGEPDVRLAHKAERRRRRLLHGAAIGAGIGMLLGLALVVLREALDIRPRSSRLLQHRLRLTQLAAVPEPGPELERMHRLITIEDPGGADAKAFAAAAERVLKAAAVADARVLLMAGSAADDGASAVVANLGVEMARSGRRVVLADLDTRRPTLRRRFARRRNAGLSAVLRGQQHLDGALDTVPVAHGAAKGRDGGSVGLVASQGVLEVLTAGVSPPSIDHRGIPEVVAALRERADLVLVLSGPLLGDKDVLTLAERCDALVLVLHLARARRSRRPRLERLLGGTDAPTLGFILAGAPAGAPGSTSEPIRSSLNPSVRGPTELPRDQGDARENEQRQRRSG